MEWPSTRTSFGSCSVADGGKEFEVALGGDDRCPECTMTLAPLPGDESSVKSGGHGQAIADQHKQLQSWSWQVLAIHGGAAAQLLY